MGFCSLSAGSGWLRVEVRSRLPGKDFFLLGKATAHPGAILSVQQQALRVKLSDETTALVNT